MADLTLPEQVAIIETLGITPLGNVVHGSVTYDRAGEGKVAIYWRGVSVIPKLQLDSVLASVKDELGAGEVDR